MHLLHKIDDGFAWVTSNGTYQQRSLYKRGSQLFVSYGAGYLLVSPHGKGYGTSSPRVSIIELDVGETHELSVADGYKIRVTEKAQ